MTVTPEMAYDWLTSIPYPRQRKVSAYTVAHYAEIMERGNWLVSTLRFGRLNGRLVLIDGYHRLNAQVEAEVTQDYMVEVIDVTTQIDLDQLYGVIDRGRNRSFNDVIRAQNIAGELGVRDRVLRNAAAAEGIISTDFARRTDKSLVDGHRRVEWVREWTAEIRDYSEIERLSSLPITTYLERAPVVAVMLVTLRYQREAAMEFWKKVATNDGLKKGDPAHTLLKAMATYPVRAMPLAWHFRAVAACWNAAYRKTTLATLRVRGLDQPLLIEGTPLTGLQD